METPALIEKEVNDIAIVVIWKRALFSEWVELKLPQLQDKIKCMHSLILLFL